MNAPPATASTVPSHQARGGGAPRSRACSAPAHTGPEPIAIAVPAATPLARTPAKNARL
jgi:hypothetical protein